MHLTEELGEATIELSRLELAWRGHARNFDIGGALAKVYRYTDNKIDKEIRRMEESKAPESAIAKRKTDLTNAFAAEKSAFNRVGEKSSFGDIDQKSVFNRHAWETFRIQAADKFKEEVSDVFSWLSAVLLKLDPTRTP